MKREIDWDDDFQGSECEYWFHVHPLYLSRRELMIVVREIKNELREKKCQAIEHI